MTYFKSHLLAFILSLSFAVSPAYAAEMCENLFLKDGNAVNFGLNRMAETQYTPNELKDYKKSRADLEHVLQLLPADRRQSVQELVVATEFFDYGDMAKKLIPNFLQGKHDIFDFKSLYDTTEPLKEAPFNGFMAARAYLEKEQPPVDINLIREIHRRAMEGEVENVTPAQLGQWRDGAWIGNAAGEWTLTAKEVATINGNPYLKFDNASHDQANRAENYWDNIRLWGDHKDANFPLVKEDRFSGYIRYPNIAESKQETIDLIKDYAPEVYAKVMALRQRKAAGEKLHYGVGTEMATVEAQMTEALVGQRLEKFNQDRQALGTVQIGVNESKYIDLVADLQRDLVAIHPVLNGNGRSTRLMMNYLLAKEGLPPVRLVDPFLDVQVSQTEWREYVHKGIINNAKMYADVVYRIQNGLTVEYSPEILFPGLPEMVSINLKKQGSDKVQADAKQVVVEPSQFTSFLKALFAAHPDLAQQVEKSRLKTINKIAEIFVSFYRSKTIDYIHNKDGEKVVALRFADPDFIESFGIIRAGNKTLWENKMNRWYDRDMLIWRGLSGRNEVSESEILTYFVKPSTRIASNQAVQMVSQGTPLKNAIFADFNTYNKELLNGDLVQMAIDHHQEGPRYGTSYGFSTSKREVVGKAFAMGAMVVAEYGKQNTPEAQAVLKSRINIATYRAEKDVDLGRLKAFAPEFSYIYGRQAEIMAIGGTDPDAVMLIQDIDATGTVTKTYYRNPANPTEVLVIRGRFIPNETPLVESDILSRVQLQIPQVVNAQPQQQQQAQATPAVAPQHAAPAVQVQQPAVAPAVVQQPAPVVAQVQQPEPAVVQQPAPVAQVQQPAAKPGLGQLWMRNVRKFFNKNND